MKFTFQKETADAINLFVDLGDAKFIGKDAVIRFYIKSEASHDLSLGIESDKKLLFETKLLLNGQQLSVQIPKEKIEGYFYKGKFVRTYYSVVFTVLGLIKPVYEIEQDFESIEGIPSLSAPVTPEIPTNSFKMHFSKMLKALPIDNKIFAFINGVIVLVAGLIILAGQLYHGSDFLNRLAGGSLFAIILAFAGLLLSTANAYDYIKIQVKKPFPLIHRDSKITPDQLFHTVTNRDVHDLFVAFVGVIMEQGMLKTRSFSSSSLVSSPYMYLPFGEVVSNILLYERKIDLVPKKVAVESLLDGQINFKLLYDNLLPTFNVGKHGLAFEVRLYFKNSDYPDKYVVLPIECFPPPFPISRNNQG
jgi:hypothetical protein